MKEIKWYKLPVAKETSYTHEVYSVGTIVNNYVVSMCSDISTRHIMVIIWKCIEILNHYIV